METSSSSNYLKYNVQLRIGCNAGVKYEITSSLLNMAEKNRTVNVYLDNTATFLFNRFACDPVECCALDYKVLDEKKTSLEFPWSWANNA